VDMKLPIVATIAGTAENRSCHRHAGSGVWHRSGSALDVRRPASVSAAHPSAIPGPRLQARLTPEQRSAPTTALGSRFGSHWGFTAMTGRSRRLLRKASLESGRPKSPPSSSGRNITGQPSRIGTCRSSASKLCIGTRGVVQHSCSTAFANAIGSTSPHTYGHRTH
jgi:hypothetical protein